jgi:hypothetical protein
MTMLAEPQIDTTWLNYRALALVITAELPIESDKEIDRLATKACHIFSGKNNCSISGGASFHVNKYLRKSSSVNRMGDY